MFIISVVNTLNDPYPRSTSFCAVSDLTHAGEPSSFFSILTRPSLQVIFSNVTPASICFNGVPSPRFSRACCSDGLTSGALHP
ncbi:MAG: hypothetical protein ACREAD_07210 [Nitrosopumilaceae archaeon]